MTYKEKWAREWLANELGSQHPVRQLFEKLDARLVESAAREEGLREEVEAAFDARNLTAELREALARVDAILGKGDKKN